MRIFRKLAAFETWRFRDHLLRLSAEDRRLRFSGTVGDAFIAEHCRRLDGLNAVVVGFFVDGALRGAAELQLATGQAGRAELAITVEAEWQDQGVGTELLRHTITIAGNRTMRSIYMLCMLDNRRMQHLARKFTDRLTVAEDQVEADVPVPFPTQLSLWQEATVDGVGLITSWFEQLPWAGLQRPA